MTNDKHIKENKKSSRKIIKKILNKQNREYIFNGNYIKYNIKYNKKYNKKLHRQESYDVRNYNDGILRKKVGDNFEYFHISTNKSISKSDLDRIIKLKIPPKWDNVWISNDPKSDIQVVGIDEKGRKQYKYHELHIKEAEKSKFLNLIDFIKALPILNNIIAKHKNLPVYDKKRVIATMLILVKKLHIRVGKEQYARENKSYGISSLKKTHVKINGDLVQMNFKGKSNQRLNYTIRDNDIKNHIQMLLKLDGEKLFQYIDLDETIKKIAYTDLNEYIQEYMGKNFSVKDFRTYAANYHFVENIIDETKKRSPKNPKIIKKNLFNALKKTAHYLRHTKAISKKSYVMNFCIEMYQNNPQYFIEKQDNNIDDILLDLLRLYKKNIIKDK